MGQGRRSGHRQNVRQADARHKSTASPLYAVMRAAERYQDARGQSGPCKVLVRDGVPVIDVLDSKEPEVRKDTL